LDARTERIVAACERARVVEQIAEDEIAARKKILGQTPEPAEAVDGHPGPGRRPLPSLPSGSTRHGFDDAMRLLALHLRHQSQTRQLKSILVMGAYQGDGRTTTVGNLGLALSNLGSKVIVIDSDFRKPELSRLLQVQPAESERAPFTSLHVAPNYETGLSVIRMTAADSPSQGNGTFLSTLLADLRPLADFILLDSPACVDYPDAFFLAPLVDGVLYVVRKRKQNVEEQRGIQAQLAQLGAATLGAIYNEGPRRRLFGWLRPRRGKPA